MVDIAAKELYPTTAMLNRRVEVWGKAEIKNEIGQTAFTDSLIKTVWAQFVSLSGSMTWQQTENTLSDSTHKIVMRFKSAYDIPNGYWFRYAGRRFDIQYFSNINEANWMIEFFCMEVQDT